jgi:hypothetical protein
VHEEQLVAAGVAIEVVHRRVDVGDRNRDVVVSQHRHARGYGVARRMRAPVKK